MEATARPLFVLSVVWHPTYAPGCRVAELLRQHFGGDSYREVTGESGLSVPFRNEALPGDGGPRSLDWDEAEATGVVVLMDSALSNDPAWSDYVRELVRNAGERGLLTRVFPVVMEPGGRRLELEIQTLGWDRWEGSDTAKEERLVNDLTHEFSRMLRHRLELWRRPEAAEDALADYQERIKVFLSHSKHDDDGEPVAQEIRTWLHANSAMYSFLDVHDLPPGLPFHDVLLHEIETSAVVALHTDSYSSREWCRREVIEAKRRDGR